MSIRKSPLLPIFLVVAVDVLGLTIILPLLPFYAEHYGASPAAVGSLITVFAVCQLIAGPILGRLSDRFGRRPLLLLSQVGTLIGFLILAYAHQLWLIFLSRIIDGITAGNLSLAQAYISDVTAPEKRAKAFGIIGISFGMGFLLGPAISGFLSQYGYQYPVFAAAALSATSILATYFLLPEPPRITPESKDSKAAQDAATPPRKLGIFSWHHYAHYFQNPELSRLLFQFLCFSLTFSMFISGFALFSERRFTYDGIPYGPKQVGYIYAYAGLLGLILQGGLIGRLVQKYGEKSLVVAGFFAAALGYTLLGFTYKLPMLLLITVISSFGTGVLRPALTSLISRVAGPKNQGSLLGLTQSLASIAQIICPLISGFLIERHALTIWALTAAFAAAVGFGLALSHHRKMAHAEAR